MEDNLDFLKEFPKDGNGLYIVYDRFTFDDLFRLLLKSDFDHEEALWFILSNCSLSALVFQERIHNNAYKELSEEDTISPDLAYLKAQLLYAMLIMAFRR